MKKILFFLTLTTSLVFMALLFTSCAQAEPQIKPDAYAKALYVAPNGTDSNDGTLARPMGTIQHALDLASPGTSVVLRGGIYYETISVTHSGDKAKGYIKIVPYKKESAIIDGSKADPSDELNQLIRIEGKSYIHIEGITFQNLNVDYAKAIYILNGSRHIVIKGNSFHDINTTKFDANDFGGASAISVKSYDEKLPNYDIVIDSNAISDCVLGFSEALVLSGNTLVFEVTHNTIKNVSNIGIDIAGHYGDYKGQPDTNQARRGIVEENIVMGCKSEYGNGAASGIYVDGGRNVSIAKNTVTDCDYGITIGCETPGKTSWGIDVTANTVYKNQKSGISVGGYSTEVGSVMHCKISTNNTYKNNLSGTSYQSEIAIKVCENIEISNNIFYGVQTHKPDFSKDKRFYPILYNVLPCRNVVFSKNTYFTKAGTRDTYFRWNDKEYIGFEAYRKKTSLDLTSQFLDPQFRNPEKGDLIERIPR